MIIADTDVLIDFLAGVQPMTDEVKRYTDRDELQTTSVNCFELLSGAGEGRRGRAVVRLLDSLPVLPLDRRSAEHAAALRRKLDKIGQSLGMGDSLIAGIALAHGLPLLTRNRNHFERIQELQLVAIGHHPR